MTGDELQAHFQEFAKQVYSAAQDLGIDHARASRIISLVAMCPDCITWDVTGDASPALIRAWVKDIDGRQDVVCGCRPYAATHLTISLCEQKINEDQAFRDLNQNVPCGYGIVRYDANDVPIFVDDQKPGPFGLPPIPSPNDQPTPQPDEIPPDAASMQDIPVGGPAPKKSSLGPLLFGWGLFSLVVFGVVVAKDIQKSKATRPAAAR